MIGAALEPRASRRSLLRFLLGSPLLLAARPVAALEDLLAAAAECAVDTTERGELISTPAEAINVFDFRATAEHSLSPGHYAYLATGVDREIGLKAVVLTVDLPGFGSQDRFSRFRGPGNPFRRTDNPNCVSCHGSSTVPRIGRALRAVGIDPAVLASDAVTLDWGYVDRIRDATSMKLVLKGILTHEDASLSVEHGVDGVVVSNHGARQVDNSLSTIEVLPEIARAVAGRIPILIDSGFRRGTDAFTALALGAAAVCVGRPYLWGLASFGQEGVEAVLTLLRKELETVMRHVGTRNLAAIGAAHVQDRHAPAEPSR